MSSRPCSRAPASNSARTWSSSVTSHGTALTDSAPNSPASSVLYSLSLRVWVSLIRTRAPSSRKRRAVAPPMPAPAAAVITAVRPLSRPCPGRYAGASTFFMRAR